LNADQADQDGSEKIKVQIRIHPPDPRSKKC